MTPLALRALGVGLALPLLLGAGTLPPAASGATQRVPQVTQDTLVIRAYWEAPETGMTTALMRETALDAPARWYDAVSYGALRIRGDVVPSWLRITGPTDRATCWSDVDNEERITSQAKAAALVAGYDSSDYDRTIVYFPRDNCDESTPGGWADQPGSNVTIAGLHNLETYVHEIGHNLGISHAVRAICTDARGRPTTLAPRAQCGDLRESYLSPMGTGNAWGLDVVHRAQLGWLDGRTVTLRPGRSVRISPAETPSATNAAMVTVGARKYWMEVRRRVGVDAGLPEAATTGVLFYLQDPDWNASTSVSLDMHPGTLPGDSTSPNEEIDSGLRSGESWTSPEGLRFRVSDVDAGGATVSLAGTTPAVQRPGVPTGVRGQAGKRGDRAVSLSVAWRPPTTGGPVRAYVVRVTRTSSTGIRRSRLVVVGADTLRIRVGHLRRDARYAVSVRAVNRAGTSPWATAPRAVLAR